MKLTTEDLGYFANIDAAKLRQVLADEAFGSFAILEVCEGTFLQAGQGEAWSLEYRENSSGPQYRARGEFTLAQVSAVFLRYLEGDETWRAALSWDVV